jgi:class 3 adenylate cyclase
VLLAQRVMIAVEALIEAEPVGDVSLKGLSRPVKVFNLVRLTASR